MPRDLTTTRQNNAPGQPESAQKQVTAKFDRTWETNLNEKSGAIGAESVVKRGKRTSGGVSEGLPGIYFAEILGFATLRPTTLHEL